ncbi:MAG TPA: MFS transporter [Burkholderiales bacterium]|nr:MFS transporter [Burkholderiales bacterium]
MLNHASYAGSRILLSLYALDLGASPLTIGMLVATYAIAQLPLSVHVGRLADRIGHRTPMLIGTALLFGGLVAPRFFAGVPVLYASSALLGAGFVFYNTPVQALAGAISTAATRAFNFSTLAMGYSISSLVGPLLVGYSIEWFGHVDSYLVLAALVGASIVMMLVPSMVPRPAPAAAAGGRRSVADLLRNAPLRRMFVASGVCVTGWDLFNFYLPIYGRSIQLAPSTIGQILGVFGAATFLARFAVPRLTRRMPEQHLLAYALYLAAAAFAAFPFFTPVPALMLLSALMGAGLGCGQPLTMMLTYSRSPAGRAGEANGIRQMANNITHIIVPLLFGAVGTAFGLQPVFLSNTVLLAAGGYYSRK